LSVGLPCIFLFLYDQLIQLRASHEYYGKSLQNRGFIQHNFNNAYLNKIIWMILKFHGTSYMC